MNKEKIYEVIGYIGIGLFLFGWIFLISHNACVRIGEESLLDDTQSILTIICGIAFFLLALYKNNQDFSSQLEQS